MSRRGLILAVLACASAMPACSRHAATQDSAQQNSVTYTIRVVDEQSRPIEGATVWAMGPVAYAPELRPADLARFVRRWGADVDFVLTGDFNGQLHVLRAGPDGFIRFVRADAEAHGLPRVTTSFAGFKRGFLPAQVDDDAPNDSRREIVLRLRQDPAASVDPRMLEFDRIRVSVYPFMYFGPSGPERDRVVRDADARWRKLAIALQADGRSDEAAAVYFNLAYLPDLDAPEDTTHTDDLKRAWELARNHPMLEYDALQLSYVPRGVNLIPTSKHLEDYRAYIADVEAMIARHGERLWPTTYNHLMIAHIVVGDYDAACRALRGVHDFEPTFYPPKAWAMRVKELNDSWERQAGPLRTPCAIGGAVAAESR